MSFDVQVTTRVKVGTADFETVADRTFAVSEAESRTVIVNNTATTLWDTGSGLDGVGDFKLAVLYSDQPVHLELTANNGDANEELSSIPLAKNTALVLGADDSFSNHSANDAFSGTLSVINRIRVLENNSVNATVTMRLYT